MSDKSVFADAFNYFIYGGNRVILPEDLETEDISSVISIFKSDDTKSSFVTKYRDVINKAIVNRNDRTTFVLLGIENQTDVHYAMPIRNMLYDALQYVKQVNMYANYHNEKKDTKTSGEFLLGITKDDKIIPVVTLVIYFGKAEWNGACKLSDMFVETDEEILKYVQDYEIMMINPKQIADGDFDKFSTDLGIVLKLLKYADDMKQMNMLLNSQDNSWSLRREAIDVLTNCTNMKMININNKKREGDNMRDAWDDWREDGRQEGITEGKREEKEHIILNMYKNNIPMATIIACTECTEEEIKEVIERNMVSSC